MVIVVPAGLVSTRMSPPLSETIPWAVASPSPDPASGGFCREEWLEDVRHHLGRDAGAGIGDLQPARGVTSA